MVQLLSSSVMTAGCSTTRTMHQTTATVLQDGRVNARRDGSERCAIEREDDRVRHPSQVSPHYMLPAGAVTQINCFSIPSCAKDTESGVHRPLTDLSVACLTGRGPTLSAKAFSRVRSRSMGCDIIVKAVTCARRDFYAAGANRAASR